ncbi:6-phosphofructokinase [Ruminococcus sp. CAG:624]|nr:6-phosphofructokinase [Ruminococcus sp. CAG:624]
MNIVVAQSGGPTCAINASLAGVFKRGCKSDKINKIYGSINGINGIIRQNLVDLSDYIKSEEDIKLLINTPSTALGSCRYKLAECEKDESDYKKIVECLKKYDIGMFFYIGGNDSMDTVMKLSAYFSENNIDIKVIGIPKTIDNDLCGTDHSPGFGSAAKYVAATMQEIIRDSRVYSVKSVTIVEIMGRHAGWLTASSCCLRANGEIAPHLIYLPEVHFSTGKFLEDVKRIQSEHDAVIVAVSEGVRTEDGSFAAEEFQSQKSDAFGHQYLSGIGKCLENIVSKELNCKVRSIELNVMQRCSSHIASLTDLYESEEIGEAAVEAALDGKTGRMMCYNRDSNSPYKMHIGDISVFDTANKEQYFPIEWINSEHNNVTDEALEYFLPLIQGETETKMKNGMPVHFVID